MLTLIDDTALLWLDPAIEGGAVVDGAVVDVVVDCVLIVLIVLDVLAVVLVVLVVLL